MGEDVVAAPDVPKQTHSQQGRDRSRSNSREHGLEKHTSFDHDQATAGLNKSGKEDHEDQSGQPLAGEVERRVHPSDAHCRPYSYEEYLRYAQNDATSAERMWKDCAPRVHPADTWKRPCGFQQFVDYAWGDVTEARRMWADSAPAAEVHSGSAPVAGQDSWQTWRSWHKRREDPEPADALRKLAPLLDELAEGARVAVVTMRGSMCPVTLGHVQCYVEARRLLLNEAGVQRPAKLEAFGAVLGFISLNGDRHVVQKLRSAGQPSYDLESRKHLVEIAVADYPWLAWEANEKHTVPFLSKRWERLEFVHFYMNGADDVVLNKKYEWCGPEARFITMQRPGYSAKLAECIAAAGVDLENGHFILGPELPEISSTEARRLLSAGDSEELAQLLHPRVVQWCLSHEPYGKECHAK